MGAIRSVLGKGVPYIGVETAMLPISPEGPSLHARRGELSPQNIGSLPRNEEEQYLLCEEPIRTIDGGRRAKERRVLRESARHKEQWVIVGTVGAGRCINDTEQMF